MTKQLGTRANYGLWMTVLLIVIIAAIVLGFRDIAGPAAWIARIALPFLVVIWLIIGVCSITGRRAPMD